MTAEREELAAWIDGEIARATDVTGRYMAGTPFHEEWKGREDRLTRIASILRAEEAEAAPLRVGEKDADRRKIARQLRARSSGTTLRTYTDRMAVEDRQAAELLEANLTTQPVTASGDELVEALVDLAEWCKQRGSELGAVDGYDYHSGEEAAYRHVSIEAEKRAALARAEKAEATIVGRGVTDGLDAEAELAKLIEFFRGEGYSRFGYEGDVEGRSPAETAIHAMRAALSVPSREAQEPVAWPQRSDGTNKTVGEMLPDERSAVMAAAKERFFAPDFAGRMYPAKSGKIETIDILKEQMNAGYQPIDRASITRPVLQRVVNDLEHGIQILDALQDARYIAPPAIALGETDGLPENMLEDAAKSAFVKAQSVYRADHDHFPLKLTWETTTESVREGWRGIAYAAVEAAYMPPHGTEPEPRKPRNVRVLITRIDGAE